MDSRRTVRDSLEAHSDKIKVPLFQAHLQKTEPQPKISLRKKKDRVEQVHRKTSHHRDRLLHIVRVESPHSPGTRKLFRLRLKVLEVDQRRVS